MRFEGETVECSVCERVISEKDDCGEEDSPLCSGCGARATKEFVNRPCPICEKSLGEKAELLLSVEGAYEGEFAHKECVDKLELNSEDEWSDDFY